VFERSHPSGELSLKIVAGKLTSYRHHIPPFEAKTISGSAADQFSATNGLTFTATIQ
jgi:hypothetical protein